MQIRWLALLMMLVLVACDSNDKPATQLQAGTRNTRTPQIQSTDDTTHDEMALSGRLLYVEDDHLMLWDLTETAPTPIADQVTPSQIFLSVDQTMAVYHRQLSRSSEVHLFNLSTLESTLVDATEGFSRRQIWNASWSPNQEWVLINSSSLDILAKIDGSGHVELGRDARIQHQWLADNTILSMIASFSPPDFASVTVELAEHYDPNTGISTPIDLEPEYLDYSELYTALNTLGYEMSWSMAIPDVIEGWVINWPPDFDGSRLQLCNTWQITSFDRQTVAYESPDTAQLSDGQPLISGDFLFLDWRYPDCVFGVFAVRLMRLHADGTVSVVGEGVYPGDSQDVRRVSGIRRYALSPDQQQVAWISGNISKTEGALHITDLATGTTETLTQKPIFSIYWMP